MMGWPMIPLRFSCLLMISSHRMNSLSSGYHGIPAPWSVCDLGEGGVESPSI